MSKNNRHEIDFVAALASLLTEKELTEIEVTRQDSKNGKLHIKMSRHSQQSQPGPVIAYERFEAPGEAPRLMSEVPAQADDEADPSQHPGVVISPMVGTTYLQPEPGAARFTDIGDEVKEGQTLLIVEAMKTMNHIPAPHGGTVRRIFVDDGAPVEFGAPLMIIA